MNNTGIDTNVSTPNAPLEGQHIQQVLLLGATFNTGNMGVGDLAAGALKIVNRSYPNANIYFLDYGKDSREYVAEVDGRRLKIDLINLRFSWKLFLPNCLMG